MQIKGWNEPKALLDEAISNGSLKSVIGIIGSSDGIIFSHASGTRDIEYKKRIEIDAIIKIASMTKLVTTIAALQLCEKGLIDLDKGMDVYLPNFAKPKILVNFSQKYEPNFKIPKRIPSVRELITHTSGYVYPFFNANAMAAQKSGVTQKDDGFSSKHFNVPLAFEPGTKWEYGIGIGWLGLIVEEVSGYKLGSYFNDFIFDTLEMKDTSFELSEDKFHRSVTIMERYGGNLVALKEGQPKISEKGINKFQPGGGGLYSTLPDYAKILITLLNKGTYNRNQILSESSVDAMFTNQIGKLDVEKITSQNQEISNDADMSFGSTAKWGLGFLLHPQGTQNGRSPGSASWAGMFNTYFWIDRRKSLFGMFATQVLPFYDTKSIEYLKKFEKSVYEIL